MLQELKQHRHKALLLYTHGDGKVGGEAAGSEHTK
jgi:hypothetical protein